VCYPAGVSEFLIDNFLGLMRRGGWVMWPLLALSVVALGLVLERAWFFLRTNHPGRLSRVSQMARLLRQGIWMGLFGVIVIYLQLIRALNWTITLVLACVFILIELFFLTRE